MSKKVTIVDYGLANIFSVSRAVEQFGANVTLSQNPDEIERADYLILPGVGAFANGMQGLKERGLVDAIKSHVKTGRPMMGICLGMQMLVSKSQEFGEHQGLDIIPGKVIEIKAQNEAKQSLKVPHIGWSALQKPASKETWDATILKGINPGTETYFVHSYTVVPNDASHRLADAYYGNCQLSAAIQKDNVYGCQFHPEKSGPIGLEIMKNFLSNI